MFYSKKCCMKNLLIFLCFLISLNISLQLPAQETEETPGDISLGDLLNLELTTAGKKAEKVSDIPASVVIVTREDIKIYGYSTVRDILENIPGLYPINDYGWSGVNFGVRGFWSNFPKNMILMVNGISQKSGHQNDVQLYKMPVPVEAIDRIEVVRGPLSVIYGEGSFYGAINIITNQTGAEENPVKMASASYGSQNTKKGFARLSGEEGNIRYTLNAGYYDTDGIDEPFSKMCSNPDTIGAYNVPADETTEGLLPLTHKYFDSSWKYDDFSVEILLAKSKAGIFPSMPIFEPNIKNMDRVQVSLGYEKKFSDLVTANGKYTFTNEHTFYDYHILIDNYLGVTNERNEDHAFELNAFINPHDDVDITIGCAYKSIRELSEQSDNPILNDYWDGAVPHLVEMNKYNDDNIDSYAMFVQMDYNLLKNLKLVAGVRYEYVSEHTIVSAYDYSEVAQGGEPHGGKMEFGGDDNIIPRFALIYSVTDNHVFKFLYGQAVSQPSLLEKADIARDGLPKIDDEKISTFEFNYTAAFPMITANASLFRNELDNLIVRGSGIRNGVWTPFAVNDGEMATNGLELTFQIRPLKNMNIKLSAIWQETEDRRQGMENIDVGYSPKLLGYVKASYRFPKNITFAMTGHYVDDMEPNYDTARVNPADPDSPMKGRIGKKVDGYFILDANLRVNNLFDTGMFMSLKGSNILDKEITYPATPTNGGWTDLGTVGTGRTFLVSLGIEF
ncbi:MAG: TonB-dependent receptor [Desulfobacterales bacterium]|nr:TonB-dependent receptor [Desulfobacterales bacterium]